MSVDDFVEVMISIGILNITHSAYTIPHHLQQLQRRQQSAILIRVSPRNIVHMHRYNQSYNGNIRFLFEHFLKQKVQRSTMTQLVTNLPKVSPSFSASKDITTTHTQLTPLCKLIQVYLLRRSKTVPSCNKQLTATIVTYTSMHQL